MNTIDRSAERSNMVRDQIVARGVSNQLVIDAMQTVPREAFTPEGIRDYAYDDSPLPIAAEQTISQPFIVAFMVEALELQGGERVLEIGTGSGYGAAVIGQIAGEVYTVERVEELAKSAMSKLKAMNYMNVYVRHGDGTLGWVEHASYDGIVVTAGGPSVPKSLQAQLKIGGRMVIPVGCSRTSQRLVRVTRVSGAMFRRENIASVRFVPLIGCEGWKDGLSSPD